MDLDRFSELAQKFYPLMDRATYEIEADVERNHWWFRGRRRILSRLLRTLSPGISARAKILDVGCGTGANAPVLVGDQRFVVGLDASPIPMALNPHAGHHARLRGDATSLPIADESFDLILALDVLEHIDDDRQAARELYRALRPGGTLVVFVPALQILWGLQDDVSHHKRRYKKHELHDVIVQAGFAVHRLTFFNSLLFAPILGARLAMRLRPPKNIRSENQIGGALANFVLTKIFALEAPLVARLNLPIGVSLACVAKRPVE